MTKSDILKALQDLPEDATVDDAMDRLILLSEIEQGIAESDAGETLSHEEVRRHFEQWGK